LSWQVAALLPYPSIHRENQVITRRLLSVALNAALVTGAAALVGCNQQPSTTSTAAPAGSSTAAAIAPAAAVAQAAPVYTPPSADQLYQMVAPIALFPDKLVAQVLAGSTYPDQVTAADTFLEQNQSLQGSALQDAVDPQAWDPSIKGLTVFPKVLDQMAQNIPWTTALGDAYANDPTDVLNAIQVMRQRASTHGSLRSSAKLRVVSQPATVVDTSYASAPDQVYEQDTYDGPDVVPPPQETIEILPADADTVYVPEYDPQTVYGGDMEAYPDYRYDRSGYSTGDLVTTGAIAFGAGIVIASLFNHHHHDQPSYGWNSWGMQWHGDRGDRGNGGDRDHGGRWQRPAVVHNDTVYVSRSTTINNRYVNNSNNRVNSGNTYNRPAAPTQAAGNHRSAGVPPIPAAGNRPTADGHVNIPSGQPMRRPDFNGALSKGQPARFAHPDQTPAVRPGVTPLAGRVPENPRQGHFGMPGVSAPGANRPGMPHVSAPDQTATQLRHPGERNGSMRLPGQHIGTAVPAPHAPTVARPLQHASPAMPHAAPAPRPQAPVVHREPPRAVAPAQPQRSVPERQRERAMPAAAPERREAPRQQTQPVREIARPQPPQERAAPRPQAAPRPAAEQHRNAPPARDNEHPKKDDKQH
jgi:hypothetical protein